MSKLYIHEKQPVIKLEMQPDFPTEDLNSANSDMFKYILSNEAGVSSEARRLEDYQRHAHLVADHTLKIMGIKTRYAEEELSAFSHGFATFETINAMVHPPRLYDMDIATAQTAKLFVDCRDSIEREHIELLAHNGEVPVMSLYSRDMPNVELEMADRQSIWTQAYPNTHDLIIQIGETRGETIAQLQARTAGAHLAFTLQHAELDSQ